MLIPLKQNVYHYIDNAEVNRESFESYRKEILLS